MAACTGEHRPSLTEYPLLVGMPNDSDGVNRVEVILVGTVTCYSEIGPARQSRWFIDYPIQLACVRVRVESVLRSEIVARGTFQGGDVPKGDVPIYFFFSAKHTFSTPSLGMRNRGGTWQIGDRIMFFLQRENGYLRTVCDQWRGCAPYVYSGSHVGYKPHSNDVTESIIDMFLTRGTGASDQDMLQAIDKFRLYLINADYVIKNLRKLAQNETPPVRKAASDEIGAETLGTRLA